MSKLRITQTKSKIGCPEAQRRVMVALGLHRLHATVERADTPTIRGMVRKVQHMVTVEEHVEETS